MNEDEFEIERLKAEIAQEQQMQEMLEQSLGELQITVEELDKRMESVDSEGNEWKTRYENQTEMNQQLQKQILVLQEKVEEARKTFKDGKDQARRRTQGQESTEINTYFIKTLQKEKESLERSFKDLEWRLDQESKAYHKANEERKQFVLEITAAREAIAEMKARQRLVGVTQAFTSYSDPSQATPRSVPGNVNIREDQRILDPRKGPIKKTAAVKSLPKLD